MTHHPLRRLFCPTVTLALLSPAAMATSFVYEGRLDDLGQPANGRYDLRLNAFGHESHGLTLAAPITFERVEVRDGRFRLDLDLPLVKADQVWLEVAVRSSGEPVFAAIPGRSKAIAAPLIGACWSTTGDSGSTAANFIGTTDAQPFVVRAGNVRGLSIAASTQYLASGLPVTMNMVGGSRVNSVGVDVIGATIAGGGAPNGWQTGLGPGEPNEVLAWFGTVSGGRGNRVMDGGRESTIAGGYLNRTEARAAVISGGNSNRARGVDSVVSGGGENAANEFLSVVVGGQRNVAAGISSTVLGGRNNTTWARGSTAIGGDNNCAGGEYSWAGGRNAKTRLASSQVGDPGVGCNGVVNAGSAGDQGTFVWADSQLSNFISSGSNQFLVRAQGGAVITGSSSVNDPLGNRLRVNGTLRVDSLGSAGSTSLCRNADNQISSCSSSARYKQDIADLELGLATALRLHAVGYRWKANGQADVGFVAEEIAAIDERLVTRNAKGEVEGVRYERLTAVFANAVQELAAGDSLAAERLERIDAENAELRAGQDRLSGENAALRAESTELRARLDRLETLLGKRVTAGR